MNGVGVCTYNRPDYFQISMDSAIKHGRDIDFLVIYNDGSDKKYTAKYNKVYKQLQIFFGDKVRVVHSEKNTCVAHAKNVLLKELINNNCDHLWLWEDDIVIQSPDVFNRYIEAAKKAGFQHLNFALHGPANAGGYQFTDENVDYYRECVGAFSYYTKEVIEKVGYMDENLKNAWEHCEYTQRIGDAGYTSPFWAFADAHGSGELLKEIPGSIGKSSIRHTKDWEANIKEGLEYWQSKDPNCPITEFR